MTTTVKRFAVGLAVAGLAAGVALAQSGGSDATVGAGATAGADAAAGSAEHGRFWRPHEPGQHFLRLFRELGLTADQKAQVKSILANARAARQNDSGERQAARQQMAALANPGDPNYAAALQTAKARAADRIQQRSDLQLSLYNVLTPEQKAQLTQLLAERRG
jgi:Spy/CpxP family protein refolding chaperone